jgi:hypothetical protein
MELIPRVAKLQEHLEQWIGHLPTDEHLMVFLRGLDISDEEKVIYGDLWAMSMGIYDPCEDCDCDENTCNSDDCDCVEVVLDNMTKRELEAYALEEHDVDIDRRSNKETLIRQINELEDKD